MWLQRSSSRCRIATVVQKPLECDVTLRPTIDSAGLARDEPTYRENARTRVSAQFQMSQKSRTRHKLTVEEALHQQRSLDVLERRRPVSPIDLEHLLGACDKQPDEPARAFADDTGSTG